MLAPQVETATTPFELWPENEPAWTLWQTMQTQWRTGPAGITGLDYAVLPAVWEGLAVPPADRAARFASLRLCEAVALEAFYEKGGSP
ncbi:hypothetical protein QR66_19275 [Chromobacterium piscinae]|nr:hypothetical protein QR66_19275 [Chromobacterium piscinae]